MEAQLKELFQFLHDKNPQVRQIALSTLLGQTPKEAPHRNIFFDGVSRGGIANAKEPEVFRDLKLLCRDQPEIAHDAFRALINLSDSSTIIPFLSEDSFISFLVSYVIYPSSLLADLAAMLLSNLTALPAPCNKILGLDIPLVQHSSISGGFYPTLARAATCPKPTVPEGPVAKEINAMQLMVYAFVQAAGVSATDEGENESRWRGSLNFLSSVFANISAAPAGRTFFLTPAPTHPLESNHVTFEYPLAQLIAFTEHKDTIRRGGVASVIKNCCFQISAHKAILTSDTEATKVPPVELEAPGVNVIPQILLPLAGPEEYDLEDQEKLHPSLQFLPSTKQRERDPALRLTHVESLLLLCTSRWGRDTLRANGVYQIVRSTHICEKDEKVMEHIERLVNLLMREEPPIEEVDVSEGLGSVPVAEISQLGDDEDEDDIIKEV